MGSRIRVVKPHHCTHSQHAPPACFECATARCFLSDRQPAGLRAAGEWICSWHWRPAGSKHPQHAGTRLGHWPGLCCQLALMQRGAHSLLAPGLSGLPAGQQVVTHLHYVARHGSVLLVQAGGQLALVQEGAHVQEGHQAQA